MGRHTADNGSVRAHRQGELPFSIGERRAALNRSRTADSTVRPVDPAPAVVAPVAEGHAIAPVSVAAQRVSDEAAVARATAVPHTPADRRIVRQRRTTTKRAVASAPTRGVNSFVRRRAAIPAMSFLAVSCFTVGSLVNPLQANAATAVAVVAPAAAKTPAPQQYTAHGTYADFDVTRDAYGVTKPKPVVVTPPVTPTTTTTTTSTSTKSASSGTGTAPVAGTPDPGSAKAIALDMVTARGWGTDQYNCLVSLWNKESGWNVYAYNPSGAYGIPQALPGSKMASAGADWQSNPATQITWGLNYISGVYGTPCGAWGHSQAMNWY